MRVERVRVGDVLALQRREVVIEPSTEYRLVGIYSWGKGLFHREPTLGSELGDYRFFVIEPGDLVLSNIQAWEGAIAYASATDAGTVGTHRFLSYRPVGERVDANWARWFFLSEPGMALIRQAAPGSTMRNRTLAIDRFEALQIPLPPIEEQRSVASRLDNVGARAAEVAVRSARVASLAEALADSASRDVIQHGIESGWPLRLLSDVAEVNPRPAKLDSEEAVSFVPMAAVEATSGMIVDATTRPVRDIGAGYKQFRRGDVIFARITPCMQNGKSAVFGGEHDYGYGSTEFHVLRPGDEVLADWLHTIVRTRDFRSAAAERFTGTAGQQRVPADFLTSKAIPVPPLESQAAVIATLTAQRARFTHLEERRARSRTVTAALLPAALNEAFSALN